MNFPHLPIRTDLVAITWPRNSSPGTGSGKIAAQVRRARNVEQKSPQNVLLWVRLRQVVTNDSASGRTDKINPQLSRFGTSMANYIAWYGKKREHLIERERDLAALLKSEAEASRIAGAAEEVRAAQIRALKSKRAELPPSEKNARAVANLDREIEFWLGLTANEIIVGYRTGKLRGHRSKIVRESHRRTRSRS